MEHALALRQSISRGLSSWLAFEVASGREELFSERYLSFPLAQILAAQVGGEVRGEVTHPVLAKKGRAGRPPQLDFVVDDDGSLWWWKPSGLAPTQPQLST